MAYSKQSSLSPALDAVALWHSAARRCGWRAVLALSGEASWCRQRAVELVAATPQTHCTWLGGKPTGECEALAWQQARNRLGGEVDALVVDALEGFDAEAFGAISGTLRAGGLLLLLTPPFERWPEQPDPELARLLLHPWQPKDIEGRFVRRLIRVVQGQSGIGHWRQGEMPQLERLDCTPWQPPGADAIYAGEEQREAVTAVRQVAEGHPHRPLVLSADRGRGKSAALGIGAAQLFQQGWSDIVVTAPRTAASEQVFRHAAALLPGCERQRGELIWQGAILRFVPPDALVQVQHETQLLLVDEAAAIPTPLLERMLAQYARIVFATTIHGYEGTGRGFAVRFRQVLDAQTPGWRNLHLAAPVRWAEGDPLERLAFDALLLEAEPPVEAEVLGAVAEECRHETLSAEHLLEHERDLTELFGLLVLAHYRTSPNDLRQLLDGPRQAVQVLRYRGHIVAVALVVDEGELDAALAQEVYLGRRRVQGHLLAQSLANHAGFVEAATLPSARVMRIAVHPAVQGRGLGSLLLQQVEREARRRGCELLGASFGASVPLLTFWQRQRFKPVRLGLRREASSGSHSLLLAKPLAERSEQLFGQLRARFAETLPELLAGPLASLDATLADALLATTPPVVDAAISEQDRRDLESFAFGLRGYELCQVAVRKLVLRALGDAPARELLSESQRQLLNEKVVQRHDWPQVVSHLGFRGKKAAQAGLRAAVRLLVCHYYGESATD